MRNNFTYEYKKLKAVSVHLPLIIVLVEIIFLLFFAIIMMLGGEEGDIVDLINFEFIVPLVTTITFSVIAVYATYFMNKFLVSNYIGNTREKTYSFPRGRTNILIQKMYAFCFRMFVTFLPLVGFLNIIFILLVYVFSLFVMAEVLSVILLATSFSFIAVLLVIMVVLFSILLGLKYHSTNSSLITSVVLVTILSNLLSRVGSIHIWFHLIISIILIATNFILLKYIQRKVKFDDII